MGETIDWAARAGFEEFTYAATAGSRYFDSNRSA